jgi:hypothetical protein
MTVVSCNGVTGQGPFVMKMYEFRRRAMTTSDIFKYLEHL